MHFLIEKVHFMHWGKYIFFEQLKKTLNFLFSISRDELDSGMRLLMECAFRPVITPETVADGLNNIENYSMYLKYDQCREKEVLELACQAAYRGNTLGLPRLMPEEILEKSKNKEKFHYFHFLRIVAAAERNWFSI